MEDESYQDQDSDCHSGRHLEVKSEVKHETVDVPEYVQESSEEEKYAEIKEAQCQNVVKKECEPNAISSTVKYSYTYDTVAEESKVGVMCDEKLEPERKSNSLASLIEKDYGKYEELSTEKEEPDVLLENPADIKQESAHENPVDIKQESAVNDEILFSVEHHPAPNSKKMVNIKDKPDAHSDQQADVQWKILPSDDEDCCEISDISKGLKQDSNQISGIDPVSTKVQEAHREKKPSSERQAVAQKRHKRTYVRTGERPLSCDMCSYTCKYASYMQRHKITHTSKMPYTCDICEYSCRQAGALKRHNMTHTGGKPYSCDMCQYTCRDAGNLKKHKLTHTDEKPYVCGMCQYTSRDVGNLKRHMMTHTGEKPFSCDKCQYKCRRARDLKRHILTHSSEKPYSCDICQYKCRNTVHLKLHKMTHTGEKSFSFK